MSNSHPCWVQLACMLTARLSASWLATPHLFPRSPALARGWNYCNASASLAQVHFYHPCRAPLAKRRPNLKTSRASFCGRRERVDATFLIPGEFGLSPRLHKHCKVNTPVSTTLIVSVLQTLTYKGMGRGSADTATPQPENLVTWSHVMKVDPVHHGNQSVINTELHPSRPRPSQRSGPVRAPPPPPGRRVPHRRAPTLPRE